MNKKLILLMLILTVSGSMFFFSACKPAGKSTKISTKLRPPLDPNIESKITDLMAKMDTLDKVGEMTQLAIDMLSVGEPYALKEPHQLDSAKLRKVLVDLRVGSILNISGHAYTKEHWHEILEVIQKIATEEKASGIPVLYGIDAIHGANFTMNSTLFPQPIGLAATWNLDLAKQMGKITAYEVKASGIPWNFTPMLDVGRDVRWSRIWEGYGEDVFLVSEMGVAAIEGNQGENLNDPNSVATSMKHFLGYSKPMTGKDRTQAWIPERQLREYFLPSFERAIEANAATIMICSGEMNGIPVHSDKRILTDLLRDELGYTGLAVSDWEDLPFLHSRHRVSANYKESIKMAINAGIDMAMVPVDLEYPVLLRELIEEGEVPMSRVDEAVRRVLRLKFQLGLFEQPIPQKENYPKFASAEHAQAAYETACESITLLKNEKGLLPLDRNERTLVTGPTAASLIDMNGGWSRTWQGNDDRYDTPGKKNIMEAIQEKVKKRKFRYIEGKAEKDRMDIKAAAKEAKSAKVAIICIGEHPYNEKPGDIDEMSLDQDQIELVKAVAKTGTPIVLVLVEGRPRIIRKVADLADAIVHAYLPGDEGGRAIADILFGDVNPSGKLPYTYPRYENTMIPYDHKGTDKIKIDFSTNAFNPQFEFGHGLSYTTFSYSNLKAPKEVNMNEDLTISVDVENTGQRSGKEVVQLYITDKVASITPSVKRLRGFQKVKLEPGEKKTISFSLSPQDLAFVGRENTWVVEAGAFSIQLADQMAEFSLIK